MTDFDYEVKQKKSLVPSARHRKGGSKSKKCYLPSDNLTEAQKRKLNGPVYTVKMDRPMTWEELRRLPDTLRRQYLTNLIDTYGASHRMLGEMLGVSRTAVSHELNRLGISTTGNLKNAKQGPRAERRKAMWAAFCNGVVGGGNAVKPGENEQIEPADAQVVDAEPEGCSEIPAPVETVPKLYLENTPVGLPRLDELGPVSEDAQDEAAEAQIVSEDAQDTDAVKVTPDDEGEPEQAETDAEPEHPGEGDKARAEEGPRICPARLAMEYDGCADAVYASIGKLMDLYGGAQVRVNIIVEVGA